MKDNILLIIKSVIFTLIYNLVIAVLFTITQILTQDIGDDNLIHFLFSSIVIIFNIFLFFVLYPKYADEKHPKKLIIPLSIALFIYSAVIAIIW